MKNNQRGFSLAEVLIAVTIASIIATMGFSIAKKGIEKAYNRYVYTGYYSIAVVLSDAVDAHNYKINDCIENNNLGANDINNTCNFSKRVYESLSGRHIDRRSNGTTLDFDTPNGINYHIERIDAIPPGTPTTFRYLVRMKVPSVKTSSNVDYKTVCMLYIENFTPNSNILLPYNGEADCNGNSPINNSTIINNILDRKDLLAFYFEDGKRGKVIDGNYNPRTFRTAREAMCMKYADSVPGEVPDSLISNSGTPYLDCSAVVIQNPNRQTWENTDNYINITDPRRI